VELLGQVSLGFHRTRKSYGSYTSKEKNSTYRNRSAAKLTNNTNHCDANVVISQADRIRGAGRRRCEKLNMPVRLDTTLRKVEQMPNKVNSDLLKEFYQAMKNNGTSQNYQKANLKAMIHFAQHIGAATSLYNVVVDNKQTISFLDTKIKSEQIDGAVS
jgi:hypothetical protein